MNQKDAFLSGGEGDAYFARNRSHYARSPDSPVIARELELYSRYLSSGQRLLEVGCANGMKLARLCSRAGCGGSGIDPSSAAIEDGRARYPALDLRVGTADVLPFENAAFDFVIFGFCLYLVDRVLLPRVYAEADRVLADSGFIGITDFAPDVPTAREYKHLPGITSYKMDYAAPFLAFRSYTLVEYLSHGHENEAFSPVPDDRVASLVLHKNVSSGYQRADEAHVRT